MTVRHLLSLADVGPEQLSRLVDLSLAMASGKGLSAGSIVRLFQLSLYSLRDIPDS
jgi:hypothetical protein